MQKFFQRPYMVGQTVSDCWRIFPSGMRALFEDTNIIPILLRCESIEGDKTYVLEDSGRNRTEFCRRIFDTIAIGAKNAV